MTDERPVGTIARAAALAGDDPGAGAVRAELVRLAGEAAKRAIGRAREASARGELTDALLDDAFARVDELIAVLPPDPRRP